MTTLSVSSVYAMADALATRLPEAASSGRSALAQACVKGIAEAAEAVIIDTRVSEDEGRAAKRLQAMLAGLNGHAAQPQSAARVADIVKRWLGPHGLPLADVDEFDRRAAFIHNCGPSA